MAHDYVVHLTGAEIDLINHALWLGQGLSPLLSVDIAALEESTSGLLFPDSGE